MQSIRKLLIKLLDLREGELFRTLSMQLNIFLIITTLLVLKPTVNSLFLSHYGVKSLPIAFILVAIVAGIVTTLYSRIVRVVRLNYLILGTLVSSVIILLFFGISLKFGFLVNYVLYIFYIWVAIFALLSTSQFWLLANVVFSDREIKRLVGLIGAGAIAGGIFGGYLTSYLTHYINSVDLPFVGAFIIGLCIPLTVNIWKQSHIHYTPQDEQINNRKQKKQSPLQTILQSKHLLLLASLVTVGNIVAKLVDYQFSALASKLITDPEELTAFFGFWFSTFNVVSLTLQLVATKYIITRFGVHVSLLVLPFAVALSVLLLMVAPELLLSVILLKMSEGSLKQSFNKSAFELLFLPIDIHIKKQTKPFIDVFVDSFAAGLAGLLLIFVVSGLSLSTMSINIIILAFISLWITVAFSIRKQYLYSFKLKILHSTHGSTERTKPLKEKAIVVDGLKRVLTQGTNAQILSALRQIRPLKDNRFYDVFTQLLDHPSSEIKVEALLHLHYFKSKKVYDKVQALLDTPSIKVKKAALAYLIEHTPVKNQDNFDQYLNSSDSELSGLAMINIAIKTSNNPKLQLKYGLEARILEKLNALNSITNSKEKYLNKIYCIQAIGHARIASLYVHLIQFFNDENVMVVRQAIHSAGKTKDAYFVKNLILLLDNAHYARSSEKALLAYGTQLLPILTQLMREDPDNVQLIGKFPEIVQLAPSQRSIKFLFKLIDHQDAAIRQSALKGLSEINERYPLAAVKKSKVLVQIVKDVVRIQELLGIVVYFKSNEPPQGNHGSIAGRRMVFLLKREISICVKNIFRLLSFKYHKSYIYTIQKGFKSKDYNVRVTALELMDNLLDPRFKRILTPLFEVAVVNIDQLKNIDQLDLDLPDEMTCFNTIFKKEKNLRLKIALLNYIEQLKDPRLIPYIKNLQLAKDPELSISSKRLLSELQNKDAYTNMGGSLKKSS